ncbi:MAG: ribosome maturation factor RimM [Synergistaceae bacterium]|jgi:16S rRNA processing protein RimM|nr:ribosome maturation factor RimM [Synergistaceae bacterium]
MSTSSKNKNTFEGESSSEIESGKKILIGRVSAAHGVRGEVRVVPLTDFPERFWRMDALNLYAEGVFVRTLRVGRVRAHESKGELIVEGDVPNRDEAEKLVGLSVLIDPEERTVLPEDTFWVDDLIGLRVLDADAEGGVLGVVEDFISSGGNEVYAVRDEAGKLHYIPAAEEFVKKIDLPSRAVTVKLIEGLW